MLVYTELQHRHFSCFSAIFRVTLYFSFCTFKLINNIHMLQRMGTKTSQKAWLCWATLQSHRKNAQCQLSIGMWKNYCDRIWSITNMSIFLEQVLGRQFFAFHLSFLVIRPHCAVGGAGILRAAPVVGIGKCLIKQCRMDPCGLRARLAKKAA